MDRLVQSILDGRTDLEEDEIRHLTGLTQDLLREKPNVVNIPSENVVFIGDLHGELASALSVQRLIQKYDNHHFVFLGDYVDRGPEQIETFSLVMALALAHPGRVMMLRGNHESEEIVARYGFYNAVTSSYPLDIFNSYARVFVVLPIAAYHKNAIFACHGGIPEGVTSIEDIQSCNRRDPNFPDDIVFQLVWNDPQEGPFRFKANIRGDRARYYGQEAFDTFMKNIDAHLMFRAHEVFPEGYVTFFQDRLVSVFSASYGGQVQPKAIRLGHDNRLETLSLR